MNGRIALGLFLAGWIVFGVTTSACGQIELVGTLEDVPAGTPPTDSDPFAEDSKIRIWNLGKRSAPTSDEDRFGDYEPISLEPVSLIQGPVLLAQIDDWVQPPGQPTTPSNPTRIEPGPALGNPAPMQQPPVTIPPAGSPSPYSYAPPMTRGPVIMDYGTPLPRHRCPPWRPCGADESFGGNWLVMQGFAGADFRPSCAAHDACLAGRCVNRKCCDKLFLANLDCACNNSAFPILCRIKAREYYLAVRLFGWMF